MGLERRRRRQADGMDGSSGYFLFGVLFCGRRRDYLFLFDDFDFGSFGRGVALFDYCVLPDCSRMLRIRKLLAVLW